MNSALWNRITLILSCVGMYIAGVLSLSHVLDVVPPCGGHQGCAQVATHPSSFWFATAERPGVPVAYFGFFAYLTMAILAAIREVKGVDRSRWAANLGFAVSAIGMLVSAYLTYFSLNYIHATCAWCLGSAFTMLLAFVSHTALAQADSSAEAKPGAFKLPTVMFAVTVLALSVQGVMLKMAQKSNPLAGNNKILTTPNEKIAPKDGHVIGDSKAKVTVVEFADPLCPACRKHFPELQKMVSQTGGKVRWMFRHYPLYNTPGHELSVSIAILAEIAAEKGKFWPFMQQVYELQGAGSANNDVMIERKHGLNEFVQVLKNVQVDDKDVMTRLQTPKDPAYRRVMDDLESASDFGVTGTPTFVIVAEGMTPYPCKFDEIQDVLNRPDYKALITGRAQ